MTVQIIPAKLRGEIRAVASKSYAHRMLIAAAGADDRCTVRLNALSEDICATLDCLRAMGVGIVLAEGHVLVSPPLGGHAPRLDCRESGATARFLLPVAAAAFDAFQVTGMGRLPERPLRPLLVQMAAHGCAFDRDRLPLAVCGRLTPGCFTLAGDISSQFVSGLLLALPGLAGDSRIVLTTQLESAPYVDMTVKTLHHFGVSIHRAPDGFHVPGRQRFRSPGEINVPGDWSSAAFFHAMNRVGCDIRVNGLDAHDAQGDRVIANILASLPSADINVAQCPDLAPAIAAAAALTPGKTVITGARRLRHKESDRLASTQRMLSALGADIQETPDGLIIHGKQSLTGGQVDAANDHRVVMAAAVAAIGCAHPVILHGAEAVNKSYPGFFDDYRSLGGIVHGIHAGQ